MSDQIKPEASHTESMDVESAGIKKIDTIHGDEAIKVLAAYEGEQTWTEEEEKKLRIKIDLKLLPVLCITYALLYTDKVLLGQAVGCL
jgi:hypothetical protein